MRLIMKNIVRMIAAGLLVTGGFSTLSAQKGGISVEDYRKAEAKIRAAVEAGKVSKEDAEKRLIEMRKAIRGGKKEGQGRGLDRPVPADLLSVDDYRRAERRLKAGVEAGKISKEDAEKRLIEMRKRVGVGKRGGSPEDRGRPKGGDKAPVGGGKEAELKRKYQAAEKEVWEAVKAGKISKEDGEKKLKGIGQALRDGHRGGGKEAAARKKAGGGEEAELKRKYQAAEKEVWAAVKAGKASKEEGEKRLAHLKEKLFGGSDKKDWDGKKGSDAGIEALKRELEALRRENEGLRRRLEKGRGR